MARSRHLPAASFWCCSLVDRARVQQVGEMKTSTTLLSRPPRLVMRWNMNIGAEPVSGNIARTRPLLRRQCFGKMCRQKSKVTPRQDQKHRRIHVLGKGRWLRQGAQVC